MIHGLPHWPDQAGVVLATGPSLSTLLPAVERHRMAEACRVIGVNDAYRIAPWVDLLYGCDRQWWWHHADAVAEATNCPLVTSHNPDPQRMNDDKVDTALKYGLVMVPAERGRVFCREAPQIHYGQNSGFQAVNLAIHLGLDPILLVGFDMRQVDGKQHFFGEHPPNLYRSGDMVSWRQIFHTAGVHNRETGGPRIVNCTPGSLLDSFEFGTVEEVLAP